MNARTIGKHIVPLWRHGNTGLAATLPFNGGTHYFFDSDNPGTTDGLGQLFNGSNTNIRTKFFEIDVRDYDWLDIQFAHFLSATTVVDSIVTSILRGFAVGRAFSNPDAPASEAFTKPQSTIADPPIAAYATPRGLDQYADGTQLCIAPFSGNNLGALLHYSGVTGFQQNLSASAMLYEDTVPAPADHVEWRVRVGEVPVPFTRQPNPGIVVPMEAVRVTALDTVWCTFKTVTSAAAGFAAAISGWARLDAVLTRDSLR